VAIFNVIEKFYFVTELSLFGKGWPMQWAEGVLGRIKLRDLKVVMAIAQNGSMSKAARQLAVSHPVISKTVTELERMLGVCLFDRGARGVEPTAYGQALVRCGVAVFDEMRQGLRNVEALTDAQSGELRIGCPELISAGILPAIANTFSREYPRARIHSVFADTASAQFEALRNRSVDLLLGTVTTPFVEDDLILESLCDERFLVVVARQGRWSRRSNVTLGQLVGEDWVLPPLESVPGRHIRSIFDANKLPVPNAPIVSLSIHLTITLVASGRYVAILPSSVPLLGLARSELKILPIKLPRVNLILGITTLRNRTVSPLVRPFAQCAHQVAKALTRSSSARAG
jgi:DNA-binding transcriptional LysR family regulator